MTAIATQRQEDFGKVPALHANPCVTIDIQIRPEVEAMDFGPLTSVGLDDAAVGVLVYERDGISLPKQGRRDPAFLKDLAGETHSGGSEDRVALFAYLLDPVPVQIRHGGTVTPVAAVSRSQRPQPTRRHRGRSVRDRRAVGDSIVVKIGWSP